MKRTQKQLFEDVTRSLKKHKEMSIRALSISIKAQWKVTKNTLDFMESLGLVKQRVGDNGERLFSLK